MGTIDRRTFLATGLKAGAAFAVIGAAEATGAPLQPGAPAGPTAADAATPSGPGTPTSLTTTGVAGPVGVDPDDVLFAWQVSDPRRGALQGGYHVVVTTGEGTHETVWDSGEVQSGRQAFVAYGGPELAPDTTYRWTVATADAAGRWGRPSRASSFTTGLRDADWSAQWLLPGPGEPGLEAYTYVRTERALPAGTIERATAYVAAAHRYQLWVNGSEVDAGPSFCFPDEQYYQATDVTHALHAGRTNAIGVLHHWYGPGRGRPTSAPGLLVHLTVHYAGGRVVTLSSDGSWRTRAAEWLAAPQRNNDSGDFVEWIDARLHPTRWSSPGFDDTGWSAAAVRGPVGTAPFTRLFAQRTRISEHRVAPASVRTLSNGSVVVDFGKVYAGRPSVSFLHGRDGHTVPLHVGYTLDPDGSVSTIHNTQGTDLSFSYIQRAGAQTFLPYWYLGFRYLQIDRPGESISHGQVALLARHATMPAAAPATFSSSNAELESVWALCARSALYTSQEQFIDTPTREKGQFLWDAANESEVVMRTYGEQNLSWQGLRDMARAQARYWATSGQVNEVYPNDDGPQNYPTFTARYPEWVWRYYLSTGDEATLASLFPTLQGVSDFLVGTLDPTTGLVSGQPMSTNGDQQYGYDYDTDADTTLNVLTVNAFDRIGAIASVLGQTEVATAMTARGTALAGAVNARLVRADGLYVDGLTTGGAQSPHASQLANAAALAYGIVPSDRTAAVAHHVASLDISVEPDHGMELLRALHAGGLDSEVVRLLTDASFPGWAAILKKGGTFTWETWTPSDLIGDSMSHGWGSSALVAMQEALLGATPAAANPGGAGTVVTVTPPSGGLTHASGTFPTPSGVYSVAWQRTGSATTVALGVPPNAAAHLRLPGASLAKVTENGVSVAHVAGVGATSSEGAVVLTVGAGRYHFRAPTG
jgi:alpha-L-rhamnosidase